MSRQLSPQDGGYNFANTVGVAVPVNIGSGSAAAYQSNNVVQNANGGSAVVAGKYRRDISFEVEEDEDEDDLVARKFTFPTFVDNKGNTVVVGSATGGSKSLRSFIFCSAIVINR
jgi:hypothetical protein